MRYIDGETGLEVERAKKVKAKLEELKTENQQLRDRISMLEQENQLLRDRVSLLESENQLLKDRLTIIEGGGLGVKRVSDAGGDRVEFIPKDTSITQLTTDGYLKPISPNILVVGDPNNYLNDVITANVTIASSRDGKTDIIEPNDAELDIQLPKPKKYIRREGKQEEELGFIADELPQIVRRGNGYDLKSLVAILAYKIVKLEQKLARL